MSNPNERIFETKSTVDLGITIYYLDRAQHEHIILGHRDLVSFSYGIETVVRAPTTVYTTHNDPGRFLFVSEHVTTSRGHPIMVVVDRDNDVLGKIVTATPKDKVKGIVIWESNANIYSHYDKAADIFYVSRGSARPAYARDADDDPEIWYRLAEDDNAPLGVTVLNFGTKDVHRLTEKISSFLNMSASAVTTRIDEARRK